MLSRSTLMRLSVLAALTLIPSARAAVDVEFIDPEHFSDINNHVPLASPGPSEVLDILSRHLVMLGAHCVDSGQTLEIRVSDVRLAGQLAGARGHLRNPEVRILDEVDWPSLSLSWQLVDASGKVLRQARETVNDMDYLHHATMLDTAPEDLPHERAMLSRWFEQRFCRNKGTDER